MTSSSNLIELRADGLRLVLRPDLGACIVGLWLGDVPVMRSHDDASVLERSRQSACYALAPYSNRLGYRRFRWQGRDYTTEANVHDSPHSMHGVAWQRPWEVVSSDAATAELRYVHQADAHWPFDFEVRQRFALTPQGLEMALAFTNTAALAQPVGLGWHPYFPRRTRSRLHIELSARWESDATLLPTRRVAQPGIDGDVVHLGFDHCFEGWQGPARLRDEKLSLKLSSSLPYLVVYTPQDKDYYCVEPVSHVSNAIHMSDPSAHGLRSLPPGQTCDAWMKLEIAGV
jgi:aldose 1-epimerase